MTGPRRRRLTRRAAATLVLAAAALAPAGARAGAQPPPIRHVFVIVLENKSYKETFLDSGLAPYLTRTLAHQGQVLTQYFGTTHESLGNYVAMVSGQGPNPQTQSDCQFYNDFVGAPTLDADGQALGDGCVYPTAVKTVADQLEAKGLTWKGYMEDMGTPCRHPALNSQDTTQTAKVGDEYAARHDPFVYFHTIIDDGARCAGHVVDFKALSGDLASASTTPNLAFITPNLCDDGHDAPCVDGRPGGLNSADRWLEGVVPAIEASPAMRDGLLAIVFDEAEASGTYSDASSCCNEPQSPNTPNNGGPVPGSGGGRTGAVLISPYVQPGSSNPVAYNHYALLRSIEDLFGLGHLGYAGRSDLRAFGDDVYGRASSPGPIPPAALPATGTGSSVTGCSHGRLPRAHHHRYPRGTLLASARVTHGRLVLRPRRPVRLYVRDAHGRRLGPHASRGCRTVSVRVPHGHGRLRVAASLRSGTERRTIRF